MSPEILPKMQTTIVGTSVALGITGLFGAFEPHADLGVISVAWGSMFVALAAQAGDHLTKETALKIAAGVGLGLGGMIGGAKLANTYFAYTGVATPFAMIINGSANAIVTYVVGRAAARTFLGSDRGQTVEQIVASIVGLAGTSD
jgi:F420-0:gamma-glutamyl ligase-like protein